MKLQNYLLELLLDEKETIEELIKVDNKVMFSNLTYKDIYDAIRNCKIDNTDILCINYDFVTDGYLKTIVYSLVNYSTCIRYFHVNGNYVGICSWLITKINNFYKQLGIETSISLDINKGYKDFSSDSILVLCGYKEFIEGIEEIFTEKKFITMEMGE